VENGYRPAAAFRSTQRCSYDFIHQYLSGDRGSQISKTKPISTIWSKGDSVPNKSFVNRL
jgi:hypothetical protein